MGRWNSERPLDGMQVYALQRYLQARDLPMDARPWQAISAHSCCLSADCTTFVQSKLQPLCDQCLFDCVPRLPRISVMCQSSIVILGALLLPQAERSHTLEVFNFDRFQTAGFLAQGTYLQACVLNSNVPAGTHEVSSHFALIRTAT